MIKNDFALKVILSLITVFLGVLALRPYVAPNQMVEAQTARFEHVFIASSVFLYKGQQGMLVLDKRNGNVWFFPKVNDTFRDPVFVMRLEFEKIDR
jgi:hypothetical protein